MELAGLEPATSWVRSLGGWGCRGLKGTLVQGLLDDVILLGFLSLVARWVDRDPRRPPTRSLTIIRRWDGVELPG